MKKVSETTTLSNDSWFHKAWAAVGVTDFARKLAEWEQHPEILIGDDHPFRKLVGITKEGKQCSTAIKKGGPIVVSKSRPSKKKDEKQGSLF